MSERDNYLLSGYGFLAVNTVGHVLISDKVKSLFFVGKALYRETLAYCAETQTVIQRYEIRANICPMPFIRVATGGAFAVTFIRETTYRVWQIEILIAAVTSGQNTALAEIYCFADLASVTVPTGTNYGLRVVSASGETTFDSRYPALVVVAGTACAPPLNPIAYPGDIWGGNSAEGLSYHGQYMSHFAVMISLDSYRIRQKVLDISPAITKPICYYAALARNVFFRGWLHEETHKEKLGWFTIAKTEIINSSQYWALFFGAIKVSGRQVYCDWITDRVGGHWSEWVENEVLGGYAGMRDESFQSGNMMLLQKRPTDEKTPNIWIAAMGANENLNMQPTALLVADGSFYD